MSSIKAIGVVSGIGAATFGGITYLNQKQLRNGILKKVEPYAQANNGMIPTARNVGGQNVEGNMTLEDFKKKSESNLKLQTTVATFFGAIVGGIFAGLGILAKSKLK